MPNKEDCPDCNGDGTTDDTCQYCNGKSYTHGFLVACKECGICQTCEGTGEVEEEEE
tara:strand:+ start:1660 stop:1830 length:171 start_codon:yes stop_codon:yes gene_type:complete